MTLIERKSALKDKIYFVKLTLKKKYSPHLINNSQ